jgi:hypothetical protein
MPWPIHEQPEPEKPITFEVRCETVETLTLCVTSPRRIGGRRATPDDLVAALKAMPPERGWAVVREAFPAAAPNAALAARTADAEVRANALSNAYDAIADAEAGRPMRHPAFLARRVADLKADRDRLAEKLAEAEKSAKDAWGALPNWCCDSLADGIKKLVRDASGLREKLSALESTTDISNVARIVRKLQGWTPESRAGLVRAIGERWPEAVQKPTYGTLVQALRDERNELRAKLTKATEGFDDEEAARWQDRIAATITSYGLEPRDCSGSESGDPLDWSDGQIGWALGELEEQRDAARAEVERITGVLARLTHAATGVDIGITLHSRARYDELCDALKAAIAIVGDRASADARGEGGGS